MEKCIDFIFIQNKTAEVNPGCIENKNKEVYFSIDNNSTSKIKVENGLIVP